mgnify:FL=1
MDFENKRVAKKVKITSVVEVIYEVCDNPFIPVRTVREFWSLDGRRIGQFDLLDEFPLIKDWPSRAIYSADNNRQTERK